MSDGNPVVLEHNIHDGKVDCIKFQLKSDVIFKLKLLSKLEILSLTFITNDGLPF
jgi:hypothetical protein